VLSRLAHQAMVTTSVALMNLKFLPILILLLSTQKTLTKTVLSMLNLMSASFPPIRLHWLGLSNFLKIPRDVLTICLGKSTYARCGIIVNVTPLEPEWEGHVTLEFSNTTPLPAKIYANEGVAQMLFFGADEVCENSYKDRDGKYQGQEGVTLPKA